MNIEKNELLDEKGFDSWSENYDRDVRSSESKGGYPFVAYDEILSEIFRIAENGNGNKILDLGFGTGTLTERFYNAGYEVTGVDFSKEMIRLAEEKMPKANLICANFTKGVPEEIQNQKFDYIISTYAFHHIKSQKEMLKTLLELLNEGGMIMIGDIITSTIEEMEAAIEQDYDIWDFDEHYIVVDEFVEDFKTEFIKKSYCSGVLILRK